MLFTAWEFVVKLSKIAFNYKHSKLNLYLVSGKILDTTDMQYKIYIFTQKIKLHLPLKFTYFFPISQTFPQ